MTKEIDFKFKGNVYQIKTWHATQLGIYNYATGHTDYVDYPDNIWLMSGSEQEARLIEYAKHMITADANPTTFDEFWAQLQADKAAGLIK